MKKKYPYHRLCALAFLCFTGCTSSNDSSTVFEKQPNIIVILTDQERYHTHWPEGWAEENLPSMNRLKKHGLTFTKAYTAACECTPSRAVLTSSEHYPINKTPITPPENGLPTDKVLVNIASLLSSKAGYDVVWKGKWHLSPPINGGHDWQPKDIQNVDEKYAITEWNPPDAGTAITESIKNPNGTMFNGLSTLGGGYANNDGRFVQGAAKDSSKQTQGYGESILDYIKKVSSTPKESRKPFCLFISLVNPHDVWVYPNNWEAAGYKKENFVNGTIDLPSNFNDDLTTKPSIQLKAREAFEKESPLQGSLQQKEYVNFYAYLHTLADKHISTILDALDQAGLTEDSIIIRTADHGELGLSHGMREKAYTAYEEMIHVPLVISNPKLYPTAQSTDSFYCHLDLLPTISELAKVPHFAEYGKGKSVVPVLKDPKTSVQDSILFAYDDLFFLPSDAQASHIRAIREGDWTYAVYYSADGSHCEFEMYNLKTDPGQLHNLIYSNLSPENTTEAIRLHQKLKAKIDHSQALPQGFPWPQAPI